MDLQIGGRVAIITGASDGMGWATARLLAQEGVRLVLSDVKTDTLEREVATLGGEAIAVKADVTSQAEVDALVAAAVERFGTVDIVVHTAGITGAKGDPLEMTDADYEEAYRTDFLSAVRMARAAVPVMKRGGWGRFVCVASENVVQPYWEEATYNTAKAALAVFMKGLSYKLAADGVLVNTVAPAFIATPMTDEMMKKRAEEKGVSFDEAIESFLEEERPGIVQKRRGEAEEVAAVIALLVSERASFVNGANMRVDGGSVQAVQN
ncbi:SDR family NAD(P)-dependent oxidoreductase [Aureimonas phyllosphaerae]|uniref:NAD(P)-dependent dehydrogenase (Short-subunit alcohol dehydrogenase family) n=1 Tax=Aureimonas phyllosphaerae TaxID=1166078 RepID=A0A7W6BRM9_9HYPH|nr:SDR family oxidoreductase [Aureimonas phyllosphaerae]MBB3936803.1 NAD(P)-dependent dehydrogenase (short-subunit alcohol dehydrogenase family) [Aureimonas phyllosphaerae]MBB3961082.1 NAD(P)-dependent dehydrogenase (short-subunit alcohol dehydrogenase family) [Aureimonas phyllosphaerae]SFF26058.1 NAD(P)-dependent dehydrogenase, short-chain alcohol dehydrogenase family [Aureimonas phyllosphaerae]